MKSLWCFVIHRLFWDEYFEGPVKRLWCRRCGTRWL